MGFPPQRCRRSPSGWPLTGLLPHAAYAASITAQSPALSLPVTAPEAEHPSDAGTCANDVSDGEHRGAA